MHAPARQSYAAHGLVARSSASQRRAPAGGTNTLGRHSRTTPNNFSPYTSTPPPPDRPALRRSPEDFKTFLFLSIFFGDSRQAMKRLSEDAGEVCCKTTHALVLRGSLFAHCSHFCAISVLFTCPLLQSGVAKAQKTAEVRADAAVPPTHRFSLAAGAFGNKGLKPTLEGEQPCWCDERREQSTSAVLSILHTVTEAMQ